MTTLLQEVFEKAFTLPKDHQDVLAKELLQEIGRESRWDRTFKNSQGTLDKMTEKAMREYKTGQT